MQKAVPKSDPRFPISLLTNCDKPGMWHFDGRIAPSHKPGKRAFYVRLPIYSDLGLACDPDLPLEHNAHVVLLCDGAYTCEGVVDTKHPERAKILRISGLRFDRESDNAKRWTIARVFAVHVPGEAAP
jgi:hypothetical protein